MKHRLKWMGAVAAGALILAACGDSGAGTTAAATTTPTATTAPTTTETPATEVMADATSFLLEITNISDQFVARDAHVFATPVSATEAGPAFAGDAYELSFAAGPGERISFATMFVQSNDWFFAPNPEGVALFDTDGNPITGDITEFVSLWDSGTEVDQVPGEGADQAPRQDGPDTGDIDSDNTVRLVDRDAADYVAVTLAHDGADFTLRIENTSADAATPTPIAPGVVAVHSAGTHSSGPVAQTLATASKRWQRMATRVGLSDG